MTIQALKLGEQYLKRIEELKSIQKHNSEFIEKSPRTNSEEIHNLLNSYNNLLSNIDKSVIAEVMLNGFYNYIDNEIKQLEDKLEAL